MALKVGERTTRELPGITRRYPVRLCENGLWLAKGRVYNAIVCMFDGNPAFECLYECDGAFTGRLYDLEGKFMAEADEALYLHVTGMK